MKKTWLYIFVKTLITPFAKRIFPSVIQDVENCPQEGRVILCSNHLGLSDPVRLIYAQNRQIFFMAKAELFHFKPFGWFLRKAGVFPVERGKGDVSAIDTAGNLLEEECCLGIFLEGTRSKTGDLGKPKSGAVLLAYKYHAPILPVCITPIGSKFPRIFHKCYVTYGDLIPFEQLGIQEGTGSELRHASKMVMEEIARLRTQALENGTLIKNF